MARAETGSCLLPYPETNQDLAPASAKWQLVADWSGDSRPAELTLTVESDMNAAIVGYEQPTEGGGYAEGWIDLRGYTFAPGPIDWDLVRGSIRIRSQFVTPEIEYEIIGPPMAQGVDAWGVTDNNPYLAERILQIRALQPGVAGNRPALEYLETRLTLQMPEGGWLDDGPPISGIGEGECGVVLGRGEQGDGGNLLVSESGLGGGVDPVQLEPIPIWRGPLWPGFLAAGHVGSTILQGGTRMQLESPNAGAARISYSRAGVGRTLVVDLRSQRLYLGSCDQVRVEVLRYRTQDDADNVRAPKLIRDRATWKVGANVGVAQGGVYDEPVCTTLGVFQGLDRVSVYAPPHAIAFEPLAAPPIPLVPSESVETVHEADDPPLRYVQDQGQSAIYTLSEGRVLPARRVPLTSARVRIEPLGPLPRALWLGMRWILST